MRGATTFHSQNNRFVGLGGRGLEILGRDRPASNVTVQRNEFADTGSCGLYLGGSVGDCRIVDNDVHHCGVSDKYMRELSSPSTAAVRPTSGRELTPITF